MDAGQRRPELSYKLYPEICQVSLMSEIKFHSSIVIMSVSHNQKVLYTSPVQMNGTYSFTLISQFHNKTDYKQRLSRDEICTGDLMAYIQVLVTCWFLEENPRSDKIQVFLVLNQNDQMPLRNQQQLTAAHKSQTFYFISSCQQNGCYIATHYLP